MLEPEIKTSDLVLLLEAMEEGLFIFMWKKLRFWMVPPLELQDLPILLLVAMMGLAEVC